jgi:hypothetical protein
LWIEIDASWVCTGPLCKLIDHLCYTICFVAAMANKKTEAVGLYLLLFIWIEESESKWSRRVCIDGCWTWLHHSIASWGASLLYLLRG